MTVNPGFGGQTFLPETLPKIAALRTRCGERGPATHIEADGGQNADTVRAPGSAGADVIVAGTAIFGTSGYAAAIAGIRESASPAPVDLDRHARRRQNAADGETG
jgi:ribulose-phosphate 3-epimerase